MGLTLEKEKSLEDVGLVDFFENDRDVWISSVRETRQFVINGFPNGAQIRPDDVAKALIPILEVHEAFKTFRDQHKLRAKYWIKDYADLLLDRTWNEIIREDEDG